MKLTMWRVVIVLNTYAKFRENSLLHLSSVSFLLKEHWIPATLQFSVRRGQSSEAVHK